MSTQPPRQELESHDDEPQEAPAKEAYEAPKVESVKLTPEAAESLT
jgi:hypothetical protein